jgi:hypothetical protein
MNVKQLIKYLQQNFEGDELVVASRDEEGNDFSPVYQITREGYMARNIYLLEFNADAKALGYTEEDYDPHAIPAAVLWPE